LKTLKIQPVPSKAGWAYIAKAAESQPLCALT